jgi:hypothetical protein
MQSRNCAKCKYHEIRGFRQRILLIARVDGAAGIEFPLQQRIGRPESFVAVALVVAS